MTSPLTICFLCAAIALLCACASQTHRAPAPDSGFHARCQAEVIELHEFFQDWFNAALPPTDGEFARFELALAPGFVIITPDATRHDRRAILDRVRQGHPGPEATPSDDLDIWVEIIEVRPLGDGLALVLYDEHHKAPGRSRALRSSAVLRDDPDGPNGVRWLHVHETPLTQ